MCTEETEPQSMQDSSTHQVSGVRWLDSPERHTRQDREQVDPDKCRIAVHRWTEGAMGLPHAGLRSASRGGCLPHDQEWDDEAAWPARETAPVRLEPPTDRFAQPRVNHPLFRRLSGIRIARACPAGRGSIRRAARKRLIPDRECPCLAWRTGRWQSSPRSVFAPRIR